MQVFSGVPADPRLRVAVWLRELIVAWSRPAALAEEQCEEHELGHL
jgi:hypothetical protein